MTRNLIRLTAAANKQAAIKDLWFVYNQIVALGHNPPVTDSKGKSAQQIDRITRGLIDWAKDNKIVILLPDGWQP